MSGRNLRLWTAITAAALLVPIGCGFDADGAVAPSSTESDTGDPTTDDPAPSTPSTTRDAPTPPPTTSREAPTTRSRTTTRNPATFALPVLPTGLPAVANGVAPPTDGAALAVTDVLVEARAGVVRVTYVFAGNGMPGWNVRYVDSAVQDGSGDTLDVPGESVLEVSLSGVGYPFDTGIAPYGGPNPRPGTGFVTEVHLMPAFEGRTQSFVGLATEPRPAAVTTAVDPVRVVVEIQP
jgi:hypothetical protein